MTLADLDVRNLIQHSPEGFSIRAAAGSGKTTAVVRRIVRDSQPRSIHWNRGSSPRSPSRWQRPRNCSLASLTV